MKQQQSPTDLKLETILASAAEVFASKGYHNASIRDIAKESGVSLSGLYYYFESKEKLLFMIQDHAFMVLLDRLEERLNGVEDPSEKLRLLIDNHLTYFLENVAEMKVLSHEADSLTGDHLRAVIGHKKRLSAIAAEILFELNPESELDPRVATFGLFGMINWVYTWYRPDRDLAADQLVTQMWKLFTAGYRGGVATEMETSMATLMRSPY